MSINKCKESCIKYMKNDNYINSFNIKVKKKDLKKIPSISSILIILSAFCAPFGAGTQKIFNFDVSKVFVILIVLLIFYWLLFIRYKFRLFPRHYNYFMFFIILHTFITWIVFFPVELEFEYTGKYLIQEGFFRIGESNGIKISRFFLFVLYGYALASLLKNKKQFISLVLAYSIGLIAIMRLGGYTFESEIMRYSGGSLDANAFGLSISIAIFLNIIVLNMKKLKIWIKLLNIIFIIYGIYGLIICYSRSALFGFFAGLFVFLIYLPNITKKIKFVLVVMIIFLLFIFIYPNLLKTTSYRMSYTNIIEKHGSYRFDIWSYYLKNFNDYSLLGVGMYRYVEISRDFPIKRAASTHNNYLRVLVEFGIVGFLLFVIGLREIWKKIFYFKMKFKKNNISNIILGLFTLWLINGFFLDTLTMRSSWILFGVILSYKTWGLEKIKKSIE